VTTNGASKSGETRRSSCCDGLAKVDQLAGSISFPNKAPQNKAQVGDAAALVESCLRGICPETETSARAHQGGGLARQAGYRMASSFSSLRRDRRPPDHAMGPAPALQ
jgi:hypothetical protein